MSSQVNGDGAASKTELADGAKALFDELGAFLEQAKPPGPPPGGGHGGKGGLFSKIESLLDQYRSTATDSTTETATSTLSVAA